MADPTQPVATSVDAGERLGHLPALLVLPAAATGVLVFAHGAGAGMKHRFMEAVALGLAACRIGTLRYEFPYMHHRKGRPDPPGVLEAVVRRAVDTARTLAPGLPLYAGGKSLGGRMTSNAASKEALPDVRGLVFFGFPLHPPKKPAVTRADHLRGVTVPMLFLQGTRDDRAGLDLLRPIVAELGSRATLHVVDGGDHSFHVLKRSGRTDEEVLDELVDTATGWMERVTGTP